MTESEEWLEIAAGFDNGMRPLTIGICAALAGGATSWKVFVKMRERLRLFAPHQNAIWYWPQDTERSSRTLRATACCFLATMADDS